MNFTAVDHSMMVGKVALPVSAPSQAVPTAREHSETGCETSP